MPSVATKFEIVKNDEPAAEPIAEPTASPASWCSRR